MKNSFQWSAFIFSFICIVSCNESVDFSEQKHATDFSIIIDNQALDTLSQYRNKALKLNYIPKECKGWINAKIKYNLKDYEAQIRLKGDWVDHIKSDKWSLKIKLKKGRILGKKVFCIQAPETRNFLYESIFHELCKQTNVLTTDYEYVVVKINNKQPKVYAIEEHFDAFDFDNKNKLKGPIFKYSEDQFFHYKVYSWKNKELSAPDFHASYFRHENFDNPEILLKASHKIYNYKYLQKPLDSIFDLDQLARYMANVSLTKAIHSLMYFNRKFYFNPISEKFEIIGYDAEGELSAHKWISTAIIGDFNTDNPIKESGVLNGLYPFFKNKKFQKAYVDHLENISSSFFIDTFLNHFNKKMALDLVKINTEYPDYTFETNYLKEEAKRIRTSLNDYTTKTKSDNYKKVLNDIKREKSNLTLDHEISHYYVRAFDTNSEITIYNYLSEPITLIGYSNENGYKKLDNDTIANYKDQVAFKKIKAFGKTNSIKVKGVYSSVIKDIFVICKY